MAPQISQRLKRIYLAWYGRYRLRYMSSADKIYVFIVHLLGFAFLPISVLRGTPTAADAFVAGIPDSTSLRPLAKSSCEYLDIFLEAFSSMINQTERTRADPCHIHDISWDRWVGLSHTSSARQSHLATADC